MNRYSETSKQRLKTCCFELQEIFNEAIKVIDITIADGYRDEEKQNKMFASGLSKLMYPNGKHNKKPSDAVDAYPYIKGKGISYCSSECSYLAGVIVAIGASKGYKIRWGGRWDSDDSIVSVKFKDLGHFEIVRG
jgi:peptidoglycan L-alanyl-D-glutamate endopeptidase CwlK